jgi:hypothetical protein
VVLEAAAALTLFPALADVHTFGDRCAQLLVAL